MTRRSLRCLIGIHSWVARHPTSERYQGPDHKVCRRCGKKSDPVNVPPGFFGSGGGMA